MIIDLRTITEEPKHFSITLEKEWWSDQEQDTNVLGFEVPLRAEIEIYRAGDKHVLEGHMETRIVARCDRCLESFGLDARSHFEAYYTSPVSDQPLEERELIEEDMAVDFIRGEEIDVDDILREQIYLSLPVKLICRPDCLGLCPQCGANLNAAPCRCRLESGHPGFSILKNMKIQGE